MPLIPHQDGFRRIWMFPRNKRKVQPWKLGQIMLLFLNQTRSQNWNGNQQLQDTFTKTLELNNLKRPGTQYDLHSGGARTYLAQLKCLGLIFQRNRNGIFFPTIAGEAIMQGNNGIDVLQHMLLHHQYPSYYGNNSNVKIHPQLKIKPFLFILELLNAPSLGGHLTTQEIMIPVIYGHNNDCLELCTQKILHMRRNSDDITSVIDDLDTDLYTPRSSRSDLPHRIGNVLDIANTCKNYLQSSLLIDEVINGETYDRTQRFSFNRDYEATYVEALRNKDRFIPTDSEEAFQRRYGCWNRQRDTRRLSSSDEYNDVRKDLIISRFFSYCADNIVSGIPSAFIDQTTRDLGFSRDEIMEFIEPYLTRMMDIYETTFIELSRGGRSTATKFEKAIASLFQDRLGIDAVHTGQKQRPRSERGGYADVFLLSLGDNSCALIDAKASSSYSLPCDDHFAMAHNYIPNYKELADDNNLELQFASYVAHGFHGNMDEKLAQLSRDNPLNIPVSAIKAKDLLEISKEQSDLSFDNLSGVFREGKLLRHQDFQ